jgi:DNA-binding beta-propeller fold protein YncE
MKLFVSHSSRDETEAARLRDWLGEHGHDVAMPPRSKKQEQAPDDALRSRVESDVAAADAVILFVSPFLEASGLARLEEEMARTAGKPLVAVIAAPTTQHALADAYGRFDLTLDRKGGLAKLGEALEQLAAQQATASRGRAGRRPEPAKPAAVQPKRSVPGKPETPVEKPTGLTFEVEPATGAAAPGDSHHGGFARDSIDRIRSLFDGKAGVAGAAGTDTAEAAPAPEQPSEAPPAAQPAAVASSGEAPAARRRPPSSFEHRIHMSVEDARQRMHTKSVPDWLAWAIRSPVTRSPGPAEPPDHGGGSAPFTPVRESFIPVWLRRLPLGVLPNGEAMRRSLARTFTDVRLVRTIALALALMLLAGAAWLLFGGSEDDQLRQELRNAKDRQAEFLTRLSDHLLAEGDRETALLLALEAVDQSRGSSEGLGARVGLYAAWLLQRDDLVLRGHGNSVSDVVFPPDPCCVLSASWDETVRQWDTRTGRQVLALGSQDSPVNGLAVSPDGKRIVTASADGKARLFDAGSAALQHEFTGHSDDLTGVAFSPDGKQFVTASADHTAILWDVASKKAVITYKGSKAGLEAVAFSPDGRRIATASDDELARIYDIGGEEPVAILNGHGGAVRGIAFDPTGGYVATAAEDHTARLWNTYTGKTVRVFDDSQHGLLSVAFSRDGKWLVTGGKDNTARIHDVANGETLLVLKGHKGVVSRAVFSADGKYVATASGDTLVRLWPLVTDIDQLVQETRKSASACLSLAQRRKYFLSEAPPAWCIEMQKPPYQTEAWRTWLRGVKAGHKPPLPESAEGM